MTGLASLPLYDWPELRDATDAFWAALGGRLRDIGLPAPEALDRTRPAAGIWADPDLLFSQTCGLPHVAGTAAATRLICAPSYDAEGCGAGRYSSAIVARRGAADNLDALRGGRFAANGPDSLSGWAALLDAMEPAAVGEVVWTGAHRASILAVAEGRAEAAAIDALCWDMAQRFEPAAKELRVLGWTAAAPAPPFVTSALTATGDRARIRAALVETLVDPETAAIRQELRLARIVAFGDPDYDAARALARLVRAAAVARPELGAA